MFGELKADVSLVRIEEAVRRFWRRHQVPQARQVVRQSGPAFRLSQQPLIAAGQPETEQARLLATSDLFARYRAMRGDDVQLQLGWAGHGLPVELAVERALGPDLGDYDLTRFNAACHDAAIKGMQQGAALAERLAVWYDPERAYTTLTPQATGAVWGALKRLWDAGQLRQERRVVSTCPRCATPLSAAEASRRAVEVESQAAWLRLPWDGQPDTYFLAWTPAPWMLVGMVALAAHPNASYALVEVDGGENVAPIRLLLAETALRRTLGDGYRLVRRLPGKALRDTRYRPPFTFLAADQGAGGLVLSDALSLERGTGLTPISPAFDGPSLALALEHGLPVPNLLDDWGGLDDTVMPWRGLSPLDAEPLLIEDLQTRGLLHRAESETRPGAQCPYCQTPLLPLARTVWLVETAGGPWIVGRDRAWGVPLPVWRCEACGEQTCLAGLDDLAHKTDLDLEQIDLHRPAIDRLAFSCTHCGGTMRRAAALVDAAFEAALLPWTAAPHADAAHLAIGLGDEHLGWLGDLTEMAALLRGSLAWEQALALPLTEPDDDLPLLRSTSSDALRWAAYTGQTPEQAEENFIRPLLRLVEGAAQTGDGATLPLSSSKETLAFLDRWLTARVHQAGGQAAQALDACHPQAAASALASLLRDLENWYVPYRPGGIAAVWEIISRLLAPFVPHLAEAIYHQAVGRTTDSVHLTAWPTDQPLCLSGTGQATPAELAILARMQSVWRLADLGQLARAQAGVAPDRRLRQALIASLSPEAADAVGLFPFRHLLAEVLGVTRVDLGPEAEEQVQWRVTFAPKHAADKGVAVAEIEAALESLDAQASAQLAKQIQNGLSASLQVGDQAITLLPNEVSLTGLARPGWAAATDAELLVVLKVG